MPSPRERAIVAETKPELFLLDSEELNAETPAHLLDDEITPLSRLFTRNNGALPEFSDEEISAWTLTIDGCVGVPRRWTLHELKREFPSVTCTAVLECAGNGRAFFAPAAGTVLWQRGAVGCVAWTGVRLADLLNACGVMPDAVYTAHYSPDRDLHRDRPAISRGVPIGKARAPETLLAYAANGEPIPHLHGGPLRVIVPGYPGSASQKWITRIAVRDREHDGERMRGLYYRLPKHPVRPGDEFDAADFEPITDMPVKSLITQPADGFAAPAGKPLTVRGFAWSGHTPLARVAVSCDGCKTWHEAKLAPGADAFAWRRFELTLPNAGAGRVEIVARAIDDAGRAQPLDSAPWNPRGYCNNVVHRVHGTVA
jgi:sulfite oxidase